MGVKYVKTDNQKYVVTSIEKVDGNMVAYFTSSAHADICGTKDMYAGLISRSANPAFGIPEEKQKKIGEYWYAFSPPQAYNCEDMTLKYNETDIVSKEIFGTLQAE